MKELSALDRIFHQEASEALQEDAAGSGFGLVELRRCLDKLQRKKSNSFRIIDMRYFKKMSTREIAGELGSKEGTVRMVLLRVRQILKDCIKREMSEAGSGI